MDKDELYQHILASPIISDWHFFQYHFQFRLAGRDHPFAEAIVDACLDCERAIPGFAKRMIDELAALGGRERHPPDFEQLMQRLAELLVIRQLVRFDWPITPTFAWEPTAGLSKMNPELTVTVAERTLGVEVKTPSLIAHRKARATNPLQLPARDVVPLAKAKQLEGGNVTLPRDNPVKDFLISADAKFASFKEHDPDFCGLLVIVWDGSAYEAIDALIHERAGLFTPNSFAAEDDKTLAFGNVDGVIVTPQLEQLGNASSDRPWPGSPTDALDWGRTREFPHKPFLPNPKGGAVDALWLDALQAVPYSPDLGAEYAALDFVRYIDLNEPGLVADATQRMLELLKDAADALDDEAAELPAPLGKDATLVAARVRELAVDDSRDARDRYRAGVAIVSELVERFGPLRGFPGDEGKRISRLLGRLESVTTVRPSD